MKTRFFFTIHGLVNIPVTLSGPGICMYNEILHMRMMIVYDSECCDDNLEN